MNRCNFQLLENGNPRQYTSKNRKVTNGGNHKDCGCGEAFELAIQITYVDQIIAEDHNTEHVQII